MYFCTDCGPGLKARGYAKDEIHDGEGRMRYNRRYAPRLGCVCAVWTKDQNLDAGPIVQAAPCIALLVQCSAAGWCVGVGGR